MTNDMLEGLALVLREVEIACDVRCVVLTGAGGAFCAGGDVKGFAEGDGAGGGASSWDEGVHQQRLSHRETAGALFRMPKPTVAVLPGAAAGAGLSLALACDLRVAVDTAILTTAFARVGLAGDYGGTWFLTQLVGPAKAKELYFLPERMTMDTAVDLGIVNRIAPARRVRIDVDRTRETTSRWPTHCLSLHEGEHQPSNDKRPRHHFGS